MPATPDGDHLHSPVAEPPYSISVTVAPPPNEAVKLDVHRSDDDAGEPTEQTTHTQPTLTVRIKEAPLTVRTEEPPRPQQSQNTLACTDTNTAERDRRRFDQFKTFGGRLERQMSSLRGGSGSGSRSQHPAGAAAAVNRDDSETEADTDDDVSAGKVPTADRYFAALEGPELETLRPTEVPVLPSDEKWPFLLRFPISAFGMCMGVSSQAMLWKTLETEPSTAFLHVSPGVNDALWWVSLSLMSLVSATYLLKLVFYFEAVRREFHHPIRVNFFFAPWIACLFLAKGSPPELATTTAEHHHHAAVLWYALMFPILFLDVKMYGQWMSGGEWRLSRVASPTSHLAVVGNFVGALLGARMNLREPAIFFFAVGAVHYVVLFVTLYQRLPTNSPLPRDLHPVFFLFVATPSVASVAWARIAGEFDLAAKVAYYVSLFLYASLVARGGSFFFRGVRFSLAWWAYTFPVTSAAIATAVYASAVTTPLTRALAVVLSGVATVTVAGVLAATVYRAFVSRDLFPNDVSIAIRHRRPRAKFGKILRRIRTSSADLKELVVSRNGWGGGGFGSPSETSSVGELDRCPWSPIERTPVQFSSIDRCMWPPVSRQYELSSSSVVCSGIQSGHHVVDRS